MKNCKLLLRRCAVTLLLCCLLPLGAWAQNATVKGVVKDANGVPVIGASVLVKGTNNVSVTDLDGNFTLVGIPQNAVLTVTYIGYLTLETPVQGRATLDLILEEDTQKLDEIVVIGYGTARKSDLTGSIASVDAEQITAIPASNISNALQGRIAGVQMTQTSTQPGATMEIRIRGTRSLTASNDPLVVLDGIPFMGNLADVNPNDIKSMDILKDASATAIYGSRGANGVILITTVKGQDGSAAKVSYNGYVGAKTVFAQYPMMDGPTYVKLRAAAGLFTNTLDESDNTSTNWQDLIYRTGITTSHDVGVTGGVKNGNYSFGVGYFRDESVIPTQGYDRISMRASIDQGIGKYFRFGYSTNTSYTVNKGSQVGLYNVLSMSPLASPYNEDGSIKRTIRMPNDETWTTIRETVEGTKDVWLSESNALGSYNNAFFEVKAPFLQGLKFRVNAGLNFRNNKSGSYTGEGIGSSTITTPSSASLSRGDNFNWTIENLLTFDRTFAEKHQINVVAMYSAEQTTSTSTSLSARDIPSDDFQYHNLGRADGEITVNPNSQRYTQSGLTSWMGRVMYSYDNKYMLMATIRSDASSRLAPGHQWHTYPAVSAGWNIKRESFMDNAGFIDALKIRAGYGETSNQAISPYATLGQLSTRPYNFGTEYSTGYYVSTLPNPDLGWEYSSTWNFGVDFTMFGGRLSGTAEYYIQNTNDILLSVRLPSTSGVGSYMGNIGSTQNKGFELTLNGTILKNRNGWTWDAGMNFYLNRNKLTSLASGQDRDEGNGWFVGYPIYSIYDYKKLGLWQEGDPYLDILEPGGNVGMIKVEYLGDYNADGTPTRSIGSADRQITSMEPDFQGGFDTRVAYKNFDLSIIGAYQVGGILNSTLHNAGGYLNMLTGRRGQLDVDYWTPENTGAKYPKPGGILSGDNPKYASLLGYFDATYVKIRTMTLGYEFGKLAGLKKAGIKQLRAYVTVQNPFVIYSEFYKECGLDPESNSTGGANTAAGGGGRRPYVGTNAPTTRNYMFGIKLSF